MDVATPLAMELNTVMDALSSAGESFFYLLILILFGLLAWGIMYILWEVIREKLMIKIPEDTIKVKGIVVDHKKIEEHQSYAVSSMDMGASSYRQGPYYTVEIDCENGTKFRLDGAEYYHMFKLNEKVLVTYEKVYRRWPWWPKGQKEFSKNRIIEIVSAT